jgi:hypothetical protein
MDRNNCLNISGITGAEIKVKIRTIIFYPRFTGPKNEWQPFVSSIIKLYLNNLEIKSLEMAGRLIYAKKKEENNRLKMLFPPDNANHPIQT